jgi:magnesium chelatase family protein
VPLAELGARPAGLGAAQIRETVQRVRTVQLARQACLNRALDGRTLWAAVNPNAAARRLVDRAEARWRLSTRSLIRVLRVARTIADLDGAEGIVGEHVGEALQYRVLDRRAPADGL